ncbi:MAG: hypothetical protein ACR2PX_15230 [Endozoicomonas sp.]|uniref:hypothetical protein n=1 Tax=Endozoicomonas sp. TaxID=1892382 RepID=UPI003D9AD702
MKGSSIFSSFLTLLLFSQTTTANLANSIQTIEGLLAQGKNVAIILISMQDDYAGLHYNPIEFESAYEDQVSLLWYFYGKKGVHFIDVPYHYGEYSRTMEELRHITFLKNIRYGKHVEPEFSEDENEHYVVVESPDKIMEAINENLDNHFNRNNIKDLFMVGVADNINMPLEADKALKKGRNVYVDDDLSIFYPKTARDAADKPITRAEKKAASDEAWKLGNLEEKYPEQFHRVSEEPVLCGQ